MFCNKSYFIVIALICLISATAFAQDLLPLSGDPAEPEWDGKELGSPYKVKPFEIEPKPAKNTDKPENDKPINQTQPKVDNNADTNKPSDSDTTPEPADKNWIKGDFFGFESIPEDQPGFYGIYEGGNLNASIILAEGGFFTFEHPDSAELDRNFGFGKLYLQVDIPIMDYWMFQVGVGALACTMFDTTADTILSNIDFVDNTTQYGWMFMTGTSVLLELSRYMGLVPWGQFFYGNAGFDLDKHTFLQIRAGLRYFVQVSQKGGFAVFLGPAFNSISISYDDELQGDVTKSSAGLAIEGGFFFANAIMIRFLYGLEDSMEFRFSIGTAF